MPVGAALPVTEVHWEYFSSFLPESVLHLWGRFGFEGFGQGRHWFADPFAWAPVVDAWLEGVVLPFPAQRWWCLARNAMGEMDLWGEVSGPALSVDPIFGWIEPDAGSARDVGDPVVRERMGVAVMMSATEDTLEDDKTGLPLVDRAIEVLGVLGPSQVYGLTPPYSVTQRSRLVDLGVEDAVAHLGYLAQVQSRELSVDYSLPAEAQASQVLERMVEEGDLW